MSRSREGKQSGKDSNSIQLLTVGSGKRVVSIDRRSKYERSEVALESGGCR